MRSITRTLLSLLAGCTMCAGAGAATWLCGLSEDALRLVCVADSDPSSGKLPMPEANATVRGTRFPLDPSRTWTVDLWSPATDMERVEELARATICYRSSGCEVVMAGVPRDGANGGGDGRAR